MVWKLPVILKMFSVASCSCLSICMEDFCPAQNGGVVKIVVGKTFDEIVMDDAKDVFLQVRPSIFQRYSCPWSAILLKLATSIYCLWAPLSLTSPDFPSRIARAQSPYCNQLKVLNLLDETSLFDSSDWLVCTLADLLGSVWSRCIHLGVSPVTRWTKLLRNLRAISKGCRL